MGRLGLDSVAQSSDWAANRVSSRLLKRVRFVCGFGGWFERARIVRLLRERSRAGMR